VAEFLVELGTRYFVSQNGATPLVFLVDDLHAADEGTLHLFHFLARQTLRYPIVLMATYRTDVGTVTSPFGTLLNALYRERLGQTLRLAPLDEDAIRQTLTEILDGTPGTDVVKVVSQLTWGNPFFVEEIGYAMKQDEAAEMRDNVWHLVTDPNGESITLNVPSGLKGLLRGRVAELGRQVETALTTAAVMGPDFEYEALRAAASSAGDAGDRSLLDALDQALEARLLEETGSGYRFHHPLIRRTLYESLSRARRSRMHTQAAEAIEAVSARRHKKMASYYEELAFHYERGERRERALPYLVRSGRKAAQVYAFEVAVDYCERALALMEEVGLSETRRRFGLLERVGAYHKILADTPNAVAAFERALAIDDPSWRPSARDRARIRRQAALALLTTGQVDEAAAHLDSALLELEAQDEKGLELANVLYNCAQVHWHRNDYRQAFDIAQRSLGIAERLEDQAAIARAFEMLALACHSLGEWQQGLKFEEQRAELTGPGLEVTDAFDVHL
jgi:tetratricopeptide (TPR) repeat protein